MSEPGDLFHHTVVAVATAPEQRAFSAGLRALAPRVRERLHLRQTGISGSVEMGSVAAVVSLGTAGALAGGLRAGDLLLPERVIGFQTEYPVAGQWRSRLVEQLSSAGMHVQEAAILHSEAMVCDVAEKSRLHRTTGAGAVDMESAQLARLAAEVNIPFLAVRVVVDEADQEVPGCLSVALSDDGDLRIAALLRAMLRRPGEMPGVVRMARSFGKARVTLGDVARYGGEVLAECG